MSLRWRTASRSLRVRRSAPSLLGGPMLLGAAGATGRAGRRFTGARGWNWRLTISSGLLYALAFNLIFFIQELFLVVPKALTPGLQADALPQQSSLGGRAPAREPVPGHRRAGDLLTGLVFAWLVGARRRPDARIAAVPHLDGLSRPVPVAAAGRGRRDRSGQRCRHGDGLSRLCSASRAARPPA